MIMRDLSVAFLLDFNNKKNPSSILVRSKLPFLPSRASVVAIGNWRCVAVNRRVMMSAPSQGLFYRYGKVTSVRFDMVVDVRNCFAVCDASGVAYDATMNDYTDEYGVPVFGLTADCTGLRRDLKNYSRVKYYKLGLCLSIANKKAWRQAMASRKR
jgi:hypothetical protein